MRGLCRWPMIRAPPRRPRRRDERTGTVADKRLVIAIFETEAAADEAGERLKVTRVVAGAAIAALVLDQRGELKTNKIGATSGGKGAAAGLVLGLLGPVGLGVG